MNTRTSVDHDRTLDDFASIPPGAALAGDCHISARSAVGIGTTVKHDAQIGDDTVLGARSYAHDDLASNLFTFGVPARPVRSRQVGEAHL